MLYYSRLQGKCFKNVKPCLIFYAMLINFVFVLSSINLFFLMLLYIVKFNSYHHVFNLFLYFERHVLKFHFLIQVSAFLQLGVRYHANFTSGYSLYVREHLYKLFNVN